MLPGKTYTPVDILRLARRRGWLVLVFFAVGVFAALLISSRLPNVYESEMLVQIVPQRVPEAYVRSTVTLRTEDRLEALTQQVLSRPRLEQLIREMDLYADRRSVLPMEDVVGIMRGDALVDLVRVNRTEPAEAFHVRFRYPDPTIAAKVTERLGALLIDQNARDRGALAESTDSFLQSQLAQARVRLEAQEQKLEEFRQQNAGRLPSQLAFNMQASQNAQLQLQALLESLARDRDRRLMLERLYNDALNEPVSVRAAGPSQPGDPAAGVLSSMSPQQQLEEARATLQRMLLRLKPEHPDVARAKRVIQELEKKVAEASATAVASGTDAQRGETPAALETPEAAQRRERIRQMRAEIESLDRRIAFSEAEQTRLRGLVSEYQSRIEAIPGVESRSTALMRDYETLQATYRDLLVKSESSKVATDLERRQIGEQFRVLDPPRVPGKPVSPARMQITGIGAGAGLLLGVLLVAAIELSDSSLRTESDVVRLLELPVVATVPFVESGAVQRSRRKRRILISLTAVAAVTAGGSVFWMMELWRFAF